MVLVWGSGVRIVEGDVWDVLGCGVGVVRVVVWGGGVRTVGEDRVVVVSGSPRIFFIFCVNEELPLVDASLRCLFF